VIEQSTHNIASGGFAKHQCEHTQYTRYAPSSIQYMPLTCTHVLDVPSHAHDQASIRKTIDQLSTPALVFRSWYSRSDLSLFDFLRAHQRRNEEKGTLRGRQ
jgi:hypothetical protein